MTWDNIKDNMIWIIGAFLGTWQIIQELRRKDKSKGKIIAFFIGVILFCMLGIDQNNRIKKEKSDNNTTTERMQDGIDSLKTLHKNELSHRLNDSTKNAAFQDSLFKEFKITRDSITNKPVKITTNTTIHHAEKVTFN